MWSMKQDYLRVRSLSLSSAVCLRTSRHHRRWLDAVKKLLGSDSIFYTIFYTILFTDFLQI